MTYHLLDMMYLIIFSVEALRPTDDAEKNERMKKRLQERLAKLKRNAERRRQRQLAKQAALAENPVLGLIRGKREGAMRRCGNCGQLGHMKTNKNCPMFHIVNNNASHATAAAAVAAAAAGGNGQLPPSSSASTPATSPPAPSAPSPMQGSNNNPASQ